MTTTPRSECRCGFIIAQIYHHGVASDIHGHKPIVWNAADSARSSLTINFEHESITSERGSQYQFSSLDYTCLPTNHSQFSLLTQQATATPAHTLSLLVSVWIYQLAGGW